VAVALDEAVRAGANGQDLEIAIYIRDHIGCMLENPSRTRSDIYLGKEAKIQDHHDIPRGGNQKP
jgi:hypothetical protein